MTNACHKRGPTGSQTQPRAYPADDRAGHHGVSQRPQHRPRPAGSAARIDRQQAGKPSLPHRDKRAGIQNDQLCTADTTPAMSRSAEQNGGCVRLSRARPNYATLREVPSPRPAAVRAAVDCLRCSKARRERKPNCAQPTMAWQGQACQAARRAAVPPDRRGVGRKVQPNVELSAGRCAPTVIEQGIQAYTPQVERAHIPNVEVLARR